MQQPPQEEPEQHQTKNKLPPLPKIANQSSHPTISPLSNQIQMKQSSSQQFYRPNQNSKQLSSCNSKLSLTEMSSFQSMQSMESSEAFISQIPSQNLLPTQTFPVVYNDATFMVDPIALAKSSEKFKTLVEPFIEENPNLTGMQLDVCGKNFSFRSMNNFLRTCQNLPTDVLNPEMKEMCEIAKMFQAEKIYTIGLEFIQKHLDPDFNVPDNKYDGSDGVTHMIVECENHVIHHVDLEDLDFEDFADISDAENVNCSQNVKQENTNQNVIQNLENVNANQKVVQNDKQENVNQNVISNSGSVNTNQNVVQETKQENTNQNVNQEKVNPFDTQKAESIRTNQNVIQNVKQENVNQNVIQNIKQENTNPNEISNTGRVNTNQNVVQETKQENANTNVIQNAKQANTNPFDTQSTGNVNANPNAVQNVKQTNVNPFDTQNTGSVNSKSNVVQNIEERNVNLNAGQENVNPNAVQNAEKENIASEVKSVKIKSVIYHLRIESHKFRSPIYHFCYADDTVLYTAKQKDNNVLIGEGNDVQMIGDSSNIVAHIYQDYEKVNFVRFNEQQFKIKYSDSGKPDVLSLEVTFPYKDRKITWVPKTPKYNPIKDKYYLNFHGEYHHSPIKSRKNIVLQNQVGQTTFIVRKMENNLFEVECLPVIDPLIVFTIGLSDIVGPYNGPIANDV